MEEVRRKNGRRKARHQSFCEQKTSRSKKAAEERKRMTSGMQSIWQRRTPSARIFKNALCAATSVCPGSSQKQTACSSGNLPWKILPGCQRSRMSGSHRKNGKPTRSFYDAEKLKAYIKGQYRFCEYGIWALVRKNRWQDHRKSRVINAKERETVRANGSDEELELGYHVFHPTAARAMPKKHAVRFLIMQRTNWIVRCVPAWQEKIRHRSGCFGN